MMNPIKTLLCYLLRYLLHSDPMNVFKFLADVQWCQYDGSITDICPHDPSSASAVSPDQIPSGGHYL